MATQEQIEAAGKRYFETLSESLKDKVNIELNKEYQENPDELDFINSPLPTEGTAADRKIIYKRKCMLVGNAVLQVERAAAALAAPAPKATFKSTRLLGGKKRRTTHKKRRSKAKRSNKTKRRQRR